MFLLHALQQCSAFSVFGPSAWNSIPFLDLGVYCLTMNFLQTLKYYSLLLRQGWERLLVGILESYTNDSKEEMNDCNWESLEGKLFGELTENLNSQS